ncbi:MAG: glycosyl hydrolase [Bacteroidota bacterium]|nr:glycosyl hydrolase [Bacteroidota bacterium]
MYRFPLSASLSLSLILLLHSCRISAPYDPLKAGFLNPPDSARPGVYWYFMDGNINREEMTGDLESMKKAGIGYALFLEVNVGVPRGKIDFLSDEWQDLFAHAVYEAERLGIRIILGSGPGWAGSGGPWVKPEQSMMHLVASDTTVRGQGKFRSHLEVPKPVLPFFGEGSLTPTLKEQRNKWYRDVCVLAFREPDGNSRIDMIAEKALYYRPPYTSVKNVLPYFRPVENSKSQPSVIDPSGIIDLTDKLDSSGILTWDIPAGKWTILRFAMRNNGAVTRPAPVPGLGFEADKFDTASFDYHYNSYIGRLIRKVKPHKTRSGGGWTMIHIDSWEMGAQNWSHNFRQEFQKRRGYDPLPYLPAYTGRIVGSQEISDRFLWDLRQTSSELIVENHAKRFKELGRRQGFRLSIEPYDMNPASDFDLGSVADIPMCEFWSDGYGFNSSFSCIESTSIGHVAGSPVIAAESFTADSNEAWKKYPGDMKNQGDWAFCMGINRLVYHTFAHKALGDSLMPGMTMGPYGVHWDRGQTWWPMVADYHKYISRCQFLLSQGKPVADILYITPQGAPQVFLPPSSALDGTAVLPDKKGYSFDGCSPVYLMKYAKVKDKMISFPGGASYRIMVLPDFSTSTPEFLAKVDTLLRDGATVIGNPPHRSPSLSDYPDCDNKLRLIAEKIWGAARAQPEMSVRQYGKGKVITGEEVYSWKSSVREKIDSLALYPDYSLTAAILKKEGCQPDFISGGKVRYTHRSFSDVEIYFISNRTGSIVRDTCIFRDGTNSAELWDAVTGEISSLRTITSLGGMISVPVLLEPYQSYFIVFNKPGKKNVDKTLKLNTFAEKKVIKTIEGPWIVRFDTTMGGPAKSIFEELTDWTKRSEEGIKYYSGIASYIKTFDFPEYSGLQSCELFLDLGSVRYMARVSVNGKDIGVLWTFPWQVRITDCIKKKGNLLKVEVANLWINRLIGDEMKPYDGVEGDKWPGWLVNKTPRTSGRYTFTTHHYYKKGDPLSESGLLGPVTIKTISTYSSPYPFSAVAKKVSNSLITK